MQVTTKNRKPKRLNQAITGTTATSCKDKDDCFLTNVESARSMIRKFGDCSYHIYHRFFSKSRSCCMPRPQTNVSSHDHLWKPDENLMLLHIHIIFNSKIVMSFIPVPCDGCPVPGRSHALLPGSAPGAKLARRTRKLTSNGRRPSLEFLSTDPCLGPQWDMTLRRIR